MPDLLSPEERAALREPAAASPGGSRLVTPAVFPSVGQLDPERTASLAGSLRGWLDPLAHELSRQLRLPCTAQPPCPHSVSGSGSAVDPEEQFWATIDGCAGAYLRVSLPRRFAAAVCERIFGAPLTLREERRLAASEMMLLRDLARQWLALLRHPWPEHVIAPCEAPDSETTASDAAASGWLRFTSSLRCGSVEGEISLTMASLTTRVLLGEAVAMAPESCSSQRLVSRMGDIPVELRAVLGQADFTLDELTSLRIGDVIALDRRAQDPVEIVLQDRTVFRARAGLAGQWVAIELIGEPEEEMRDEY
jgi:flagellar motor switch protein FliN